MANTTRTSRFSRGITAATTLAAVLSVAGAASAAGVGGVGGHHEVRAGLSDAQVVRVFAAVFEAMARDLLKPGHSNAALAETPATLTAAKTASPLPLFEYVEADFVSPLPARLLDLPPPTC